MTIQCWQLPCGFPRVLRSICVINEGVLLIYSQDCLFILFTVLALFVLLSFLSSFCSVIKIGFIFILHDSISFEKTALGASVKRVIDYPNCFQNLQVFDANN